MIVPVNFVGKTGLIKDQEPYDLPPSFWTDSRNVRFELGGISRAPSWRTLTQVGGTPPIPYGLFFAQHGSDRYWVSTSLASVDSISGGVVADITRGSGAYTGTVLDHWNGGMFNDHLILNNGVDIPQFWDLPGAATTLADLTNWPSTHRAKVLKPFKQFLVALDLTISGDRDDRLVLWSHPADPLAIPTSWDVTDETVDAGQISLAEGEDGIIDGLQVGNQFLIGTGEQTWAMSFIGGQDVMAFRRVFGEVGLLAQGCAITFLNKVFQVTADDFVVHDLQSVTSIGFDKVRKWFFNSLTADGYPKVRVVRKLSAKEAWVCFPYQGSATNNMALVWNWQFDTWAVHDLPVNHHSIASGPTAPTSTGETWATISGDWASQTSSWDTNTYERAVEGLVLISDSSLLQVNGEGIATDDATVSYVERTGLGVKGSTNTGEVVIDHGRLAVMREMWPKFIAPVGTTFEITVGFSMDRASPTTWQTPQNFTVGAIVKLGFFGTFRYLALRIRCLEIGVDWKLMGFDLDLEPTSCL